MRDDKVGFTVERLDKVHERVGRLRALHGRVARHYDVRVAADETGNRAVTVNWITGCTSVGVPTSGTLQPELYIRN